MNGQDSPAEIFDVFLCHNSEDKPAVRQIAERLSQENIKPWLDEADIITGGYWHDVIGKQIETVKAAAVFFGSHGVGRWQSREIIALLNQSDRRGCPIIPVILASSDTNPPVVPWSLEGLNWVDFHAASSQPLKRLIWGITGQKPAELYRVPESEKPATMHEANKRLLVVGAETKKLRFDDPESSEARLYPPLVDSPNQDQAGQLEILRRRVKEYWVDGVLRHSLYNEVLISLGKQQMVKAVDAPPWKYTVEVSDNVNSSSLENRDISAIHDATGLLLVLGEPGSGKTTTLLDLTRTLLDRAGKNIRERVPIVLNLSSWKRQPLVEWMSSELSEKYRVPRKIGRSWLQRNYLLPLLDGLDEVETTLQPGCVAAVNAFIEGSNPPSGLVVCCRLNEYRWLPERLKLNGAIHLKPLTADEIEQYLVVGGPKLATLLEAVRTDSVLQELAQTPLMLSIMSLAFRGSGSNEFASQKGDSPEERRKQIFRLYVKKMFEREEKKMLERKEPISLPFPKERTIGWLSWLAGNMRQHSQSEFLVEGLQPTWLSTKTERCAYGTVLACAICLTFALIGVAVGGLIGVLCAWGGWTWKGPFLALGDGMHFGLLVGLIVGPITTLIGGLGRARSLYYVNLVETISWNWSRFWRGTIPGLIAGLIFGLIAGFLDVTLRTLFTSWPILGWVDLLRSGLIFGALFGFVTGLAGGLANRFKVGKAFPNQGIKSSGRNSLAVFLATVPTFGLICGLVGEEIDRPNDGLIKGLITGLIIGSIGGLKIALNLGGSAVIKHYALRMVFWRSGYTPLNFIHFLDHCARLIFLKKVGGGYIFIHRMILDYFADLSTIEKSAESKRG